MQDLIPKIDRRRSLMHRYGSALTRISDRHQADLAIIRGAKLRRADALMRNVVESSFDGIITLREDGRVETANPAALKTFGYRQTKLPGKKVQSLLPSLLPSKDDQGGETLFQPGSGPKEMEGRRQDGKHISLEVAVSQTLSDGEPLFVMILRDITERQEQQDQLRHQALHDALTGLPNRILMSDRLEFCLEFARRTKDPMALLLLDLDQFKEVNDTLGHQVGDGVLIEVARRLAHAIRASDTVARLGGDEFAVLLPAVTDLPKARMVAERIVKGLSAPFEVPGGLTLDVGVSIGIALHPDHADEPGKLLQCADIAMYTAKAQQLGITLYDEDKDTHSVRHLTLTGALKRAIEQDELEFHYQPQIDIRTQEVVSVEALARWDHPEHGAISPEEFIPQAERTGLIESLTRWAFGSALRKLVDWRAEKVPLSISVNLSARNLHEKDLPDIAQRLCDEYGVPTNDLVLELTESALMVDPEGALAVVRRLADMGFRLSIDDFGTGFSSLSYLRHLPVQELKIDQSFVMGMLRNEEDLVIVRSTIDLAHNLGLLVVAEGIESARHIDMLRDLGCDVGQGYHISRPMSDDAIKKWIESGDWVIADKPVRK